MPKDLERALIRAGQKRGLSGDQLDDFVYGTMVNRGWKPRRKKG